MSLTYFLLNVKPVYMAVGGFLHALQMFNTVSVCMLMKVRSLPTHKRYVLMCRYVFQVIRAQTVLGKGAI